ncbi:MAG: preprotein translocase subunit SecE [Chloroflexaceae bacterium]|nr:preprotein translocase subunit SecE [Chloroflexaceae bacterium]
MAVVKEKNVEPIKSEKRENKNVEPPKTEKRENFLVRTFRETRSELRKVVWPTREEITRLTILVISVSAVIGTILFAGDSLFLWLYTGLVNLVSGA